MDKLMVRIDVWDNFGSPNDPVFSLKSSSVPMVGDIISWFDQDGDRQSSKVAEVEWLVKGSFFENSVKCFNIVNLMCTRIVD
jgi:hypothetical protein